MTAYVEWVLGASRTASAPFVTIEIDSTTGAMFARNPWNPTFATRVASGCPEQAADDRGVVAA